MPSRLRARALARPAQRVPCAPRSNGSASMLGAPDEADGWRAPFRYLTIREWSFVLLAAAAGLGGLALAHGLRKSAAPDRRGARLGRSLARVCLVSSVTGLVVQSLRLDEAIVHVSDAPVLLSPRRPRKRSAHCTRASASRSKARIGRTVLVRSRNGIGRLAPQRSGHHHDGRASPAPSQTMER